MTDQTRTKGPDHPASAYTHADIDRIAKLLLDGMSASRIAAEMHKTKGGIIGIVNRNDRLKAIGFARGNGRGKNTKPQNRNRSLKTRPGRGICLPRPGRSRVRQPPTELRVPEMVVESHGLPLSDDGINNHTCKFAVNNAAPGEQHLFCGNPVKPDTSWCPEHHVLVYRQPEQHAK